MLRRLGRGRAGRSRRHVRPAADLADPQHGDVLTMAVLAAAVLPATLLEDDDLVEPVLRHDDGAHRGPRHHWRADRHGTLAADREHVGEGDGRARLGLQLLHLDEQVGGDAVLLPAGADHCEHLSALTLCGRPDTAPRASWRDRTATHACTRRKLGRGHERQAGGGNARRRMPCPTAPHPGSQSAQPTHGRERPPSPARQRRRAHPSCLRCRPPPITRACAAGPGRTALRRGARVVDRGGLENRCAFAGTVGSNPTLSASP